MLSQIRAPAGWERFLQIYSDFFFWSSGASCRSRIWAELRSRSCPGASEQRGNPPAAPGEQRKVSTYSHISAGARLCRLKLTSSAEKTRLSEKTLRAVRTGWFQNFPELWKKKKPTVRIEATRGRTFRPSSSSSAVWTHTFSSSSELTDVTGCVLPNPEVCWGNSSAAAPPAAHRGPGGANLRPGDLQRDAERSCGQDVMSCSKTY